MLLAGKNSIRKTLYDVLSVKEDASYDEIRASYRAAILDSHPDKLQGKFNAFEPHHEIQERFLMVQKAWKMLGDINSRAVYDNELKASRQDFETADDVKIEEMTAEDSGEVLELYYQCRCGDYISVNSIELGEMGFSLEGNERRELQTIEAAPASIVLPCGSCSLKIRLILETNC
ncbi:uncharacterized protein LOC143889502 [Tasmannia lanceolata]|uniref:uncharacterized protein LOC143889502 n=1 Tax=Tasmannia lanceolata TaxID=3420 RepID=UPI004063EE3F